MRATRLLAAMTGSGATAVFALVVLRRRVGPLRLDRGRAALRDRGVTDLGPRHRPHAPLVRAGHALADTLADRLAGRAAELLAASPAALTAASLAALRAGRPQRRPAP